MLEGAISGGLNELKISNADFDLGSQKAKIDLKVSGVKSFLLENSLKDLKVDLSAAVKEMNFDDLYNYWPRYLSDDAWSWCKDSIRGGQIKNVRFDFRFAYDDKSKNFGLADLSGSGDISDTNLNYLKEMPDITNLYGRAHFSKTNIKIDVDKGVSEGVILTGGYVNLYDLDKYNNYADIDLKLSSSVTDALRLIDNPPLGYTSEMGLKPDALQGQAETELGLKFEIKNDLTPEEVEVKVKSDLTEVRVPDAFKNKTVTADELKLEVDNQGLALSGDAKLENIPLKLSWNERFADKTIAAAISCQPSLTMPLKRSWILILPCLIRPMLTAMHWLMPK